MFDLSIGCREGLLPPQKLAGYMEPISPIGVEESETESIEERGRKGRSSAGRELEREGEREGEME